MTGNATMTEIFAETPCRHAQPCQDSALPYWDPDFDAALGRRAQAKAVGSAISALFRLVTRAA